MKLILNVTGLILFAIGIFKWLHLLINPDYNTDLEMQFYYGLGYVYAAAILGMISIIISNKKFLV